MTKYSLLTTASVAVLALAITSPALAGPNDFANKGNAQVDVFNGNFGGNGGSGGTGGDATVGVGTQLGGAGGAANGAAGGTIASDRDAGGAGNDVNANSGNHYTRKTVNVSAVNNQNQNHVAVKGEYMEGGPTIDTSGGYNKQKGNSAHADSSAGAAALNVNLTDISGGDATGGLALAVNAAGTVAVGGTVMASTNANDTADATGDASAHATGSANNPQGATAESGTTQGGDGGTGAQTDSGNSGGSNNVNETLGGEALAEAFGGDTSGDQNANGGGVSSGVTTVDGLGSAAGAFAMNGASGSFGVGNAANAVAARVSTINN